MPAASPDSTYGLMTPATVVQTPEPERLYRRLNPVAALCALSTTGAVHVTVKALPGPCARDAALGGYAACGVGELGCPKGRIVAMV